MFGNDHMAILGHMHWSVLHALVHEMRALINGSILLVIIVIIIIYYYSIFLIFFLTFLFWFFVLIFFLINFNWFIYFFLVEYNSVPRRKRTERNWSVCCWQFLDTRAMQSIGSTCWCKCICLQPIGFVLFTLFIWLLIGIVLHFSYDNTITSLRLCSSVSLCTW